MNVEAIQAWGMHDEVEPLQRQLRAAGGPPFAERIAEGLQTLNTQLLTTQRDLQALAVGDVENLHGVMVRLEESRVGLQLLLQVRNRALEAYQDLMRMQV